MHTGVDENTSLKPGSGKGEGAQAQSAALIAAKDHQAAWVTPGSLPWILRHKT